MLLALCTRTAQVSALRSQRCSVCAGTWLLASAVARTREIARQRLPPAWSRYLEVFKVGWRGALHRGVVLGRCCREIGWLACLHARPVRGRVLLLLPSGPRSHLMNGKAAVRIFSPASPIGFCACHSTTVSCSRRPWSYLCTRAGRRGKLNSRPPRVSRTV